VVSGKPLHVHNWIEHRRSGQRFQEVCVNCLKTSDWFEGDKHVTPIHHHNREEGMGIQTYDGPLYPEDDERPHMEYETPYLWPKPGLCTFQPCYANGTVYDDLTVTKHHWSNRPKGQLNSRCPDHQAKYEART